MKYIRSEHYLIDYRKKSKEHVGTFYGTKEVDLEKRKIFITSPKSGQPNVTIELEGNDFLEFKTYIEGNETPVTSGKFLNQDYEEMIFSSDLPEKGISVDGVLSKVSDQLFVSTKTVRIKSTGEIGAVVQEILNMISKEDFERGILEPNIA